MTATSWRSQGRRDGRWARCRSGPPSLAEFASGRLLDNPRRIGKPLRGDLSELHVARVSDYRVRYRIDEARRTVVVLDVAGRSDAYRPK